MTVSLALLALLVIILWVILVATSGELRTARIQAAHMERALHRARSRTGKPPAGNSGVSSPPPPPAERLNCVRRVWM